MKKQGKKWMLVVLALLALVTVALPLVGCKNDTVAEQTGDGTGSGDPGTGDQGSGDPGTDDPGTGDGTGSGDGNPGTGDGTGSGDGNQGTGDGTGSGSGNQGSGDPEQPVTYTVSFDTNGGGSIDSQPIVNGQTATKPADPTLENNVFGGWYSDEELTSEYDFTTPVTGSFTLYAKWVERIEVTADYVSTVISGLTGDGSYILVVTGELNDLSAIKTALDEKPNAKVNLDLSKVSGLTEIGPEAFKGCSGLTSISIPEGVEIIGGGAFFVCKDLTSIDLSKATGLTTIGAGAFEGCRGLTSIDLSKATGLTTIRVGAFGNCRGLTSISIPSSVTSIGDGAFYGCSSLTSISIPEGVKSIGMSAFYECSELTSIDLSKATGLTTIGEAAFQGCSGLTSINIPEGVTTIEVYAFNGCSELTTVTMEATEPPELGSSAFSNTSTGLQILVPSSSVNDYKAANNWKDLTIEAIPEPTS